MAILVQDSFNRADNTTGLGVADTGQTWEKISSSGVWGIQSNQAYWVNGNPALYTVDSGQSDVQITLDNIVASSGQPGGAVAFRVSDISNYWFYRNLTSTHQLYKVVAGTATLVSSLAGSLAAGTRQIKIIANGSSIECYVDNVLQVSITDSHNQTATKHGLRNHTTTTTKFDNFLVESLGAAPTGTDGATAFDLKQMLFQDSAIANDTKQVLYQDSTISFDTIQQLFESGTIGAISFDLLVKLYSDGNAQNDLKQTIYSDSATAFDTLQEIFNSGVVGSTPFDLRVVLYNDNKADNDVIQTFYQDGLIDFDTMIRITEGEPIFAVIRLKGKQVLGVELVGQQQNGIHLKGLIQ